MSEQQIPGVPEGWRIKAIGNPQTGTIVAMDGRAHQWVGDEPTVGAFAILERIEEEEVAGPEREEA